MDPHAAAADRPRLDARTTAWLIAQREQVAELALEVARLKGHLEASERYRLVLRESPDNAASMRSFFSREPRSTMALLGRIAAQGHGVTARQMNQLSLPTLVIANEGDYVHPMTMAKSIAGLIPGAKLKVIPAKNAAREAYIDAFKAAMDDFLAHIDE